MRCADCRQSPHGTVTAGRLIVLKATRQMDFLWHNL